MSVSKKFFVFLITGILLGIISCSMPGIKSQKTELKNSVVTTTTDIKVKNKIIGGYSAGNMSFSIDALNFGNSAQMITNYTDWVKYYVTNSGCSTGQLRVQRDNSTHGDTVSEGIGYGMLLAVYYNDRATFDGLYNYCKAHFIKVSGSTVPLMHWKVDSKGNNVSEFADYLVDTTTRYTFYVNGKSYSLTSALPNVPHDLVYGNLKSGKVWVVPSGTYASAENTYFQGSSDWYKMCDGTRDLSSATDADEDIAAALCFASKMGWSSSINYSQEATNMVNAIQKYDFTLDGFVKGGNSWGGITGWNPSYVTAAYYNNVFAKQCPNSAKFWSAAYENMHYEMTFVKNKILGFNGNNPASIYYPDWCRTDGSVKQFSYSNATDREYYNYGTASDPKPTNYLDSPTGGYYHDARWMDNTSKSQYTSHFLSFNFYYDACRVPWRIATDYAWGGNYNDIMDCQYQSFKDYNAFMNRGACFVDGSAWKFDYRDGFNRSTGYSADAKTFVYMAACSQMLNTPDTNYWTKVSAGGISSPGDYGYFGSALKMLSLLFLTGKFQNLYDSNFSAPYTKVAFNRLYSSRIGDHFYTTSSSEVNTAVGYGYTYETIECYIYKPSIVDGKTTALFRLYSPVTGDHFYTTNWDEARYCGYTFEGIAGNVYSSNSSGTTPVYRYFNGKDHFYTINWNILGSGAGGYSYEGIAFYAMKS